MTLSAIYQTTMTEYPPPPADHCDDATSSDHLPHESRRESRPSPPPPRRVNHTYRDFSRFEPISMNKDRRSSSNFPAKLHMMLSNPEHAHVISWMPHGRAWKILNKDLLVSEVIPQYFVQTKYESFTRQLSGWGFKRLHQSGPDFRAYYHECFLRGLPHLTQLMKRVPGNLGRLIPHVEGEPNFYEMSQSHPLPLEEQWSKRPGSRTPPTYQPPSDVMPHHSHGSSGIVPPPPPPNSYYGNGCPPPPSPPSHGANSCTHSRSPESSYAASYSTPYGESYYDSYHHAPSACAPYYEQTGYYGSTAFQHSQQNPPPHPYFHYGPPRQEYHSTMPFQYPLAPYVPDPYYSSSSNGGSPLEPLPLNSANDVGY
mmetsp:Transcript_27391/g.54803  ORF Transcript_27391/g.54803 Transcript_27391/m.54803 type:complete len:369 (+) Transcript_27391:214-1320(+)